MGETFFIVSLCKNVFIRKWLQSEIWQIQVSNNLKEGLRLSICKDNMKTFQDSTHLERKKVSVVMDSNYQ